MMCVQKKKKKFFFSPNGQFAVSNDALHNTFKTHSPNYGHLSIKVYVMNANRFRDRHAVYGFLFPLQSPP